MRGKGVRRESRYEIERYKMRCDKHTTGKVKGERVQVGSLRHENKTKSER